MTGLRRFWAWPWELRGAGVLGMMRFGRDHTFLLDEDMQLQEDVLAGFLEARAGAPFLIFGFTFMVWMHFHAPARHLVP